MTTITNVLADVREHARQARDAAADAQNAARAEVRPIEQTVTQQGAALETVTHDLKETTEGAGDTAARVSEVEDAVDTLILDLVMGGTPNV